MLLMAKYIPYNYNQNLMVVINFQDQLQAGIFEHALHYLVTKKLDLSIFESAFKNDKKGRPAYDPAILLKIKARLAGNGHPLSRAATPSWVILDTPNGLKVKDRSKCRVISLRVSKGRKRPMSRSEPRKPAIQTRQTSRLNE